VQQGAAAQVASASGVLGVLSASPPCKVRLNRVACGMDHAIALDATRHPRSRASPSGVNMQSSFVVNLDEGPAVAGPSSNGVT